MNRQPMINRLITAATLTVASCGTPVYASSLNLPCIPMERMAEFLFDRGEKPIVTGLDIDGNVVSIWLDWDTTEWSYVVTDMDTKISCMVNLGYSMKPFSFSQWQPA